MSYLTAVLMGLVQGIAEFLPISSSGHLALFMRFFGMENVEQNHLFFTVLLHFGTLIAVFIVYWQDIADMVVEFFRGISSLFGGNGKRQAGSTPSARRLVMLIIIGTLPLFVALPFKDMVEAAFTNITLISLALLVTGFILFFTDRMARGRKSERTATVLDALLVGCAQGIALIPGLSRSGTTISAGMARGFDRAFAVRFSFLLSLPAVLGATLLSLLDAMEAGFDTALLPMYLVGTLVSAVCGYFAIRLVKAMASKGKFGAFAYYCWAVGAISLVANFIL